MKLSTREDIDRPIAEVFAAMTDFSAFESRLTARGIDATREPGPVPPAPGARWSAPVHWRGKHYDATAELVSVDADTGYAIAGRLGGVTSLLVVDMMALSRGSTRMFVSVDLKPTTLSSRILLQSLKLTKGALTKRFKTRVKAIADDIKNRSP